MVGTREPAGKTGTIDILDEIIAFFNLLIREIDKTEIGKEYDKLGILIGIITLKLNGFSVSFLDFMLESISYEREYGKNLMDSIILEFKEILERKNKFSLFDRFIGQNGANNPINTDLKDSLEMDKCFKDLGLFLFFRAIRSCIYNSQTKTDPDKQAEKNKEILTKILAAIKKKLSRISELKEILCSSAEGGSFVEKPKQYAFAAKATADQGR